MADHKPPNWITKLLLLVWKDFLMLKARKRYMIVLLLFFAIFPLLCMCVRLFATLKTSNQITEPKPTALCLSKFPSYIYFSPNTKLIKSIVAELKVNNSKGFENKYKLNNALVQFSKKSQSVIGIEFSDNWNEWPDKLSFTLRSPHKLEFNVNIMYAADGEYPLYKTGFLAIQQALSQVHIKHKLKEVNKTQKDLNFPLIEDLPSPPVFKETLLKALAPFVIQLVFLAVTMNLTKTIVEEKELQLKGTLMQMGVGSCLQWVAWYIHTFIIGLIGSLTITLLWKLVLPDSEISFLPFTHWSMLLVVLLVVFHCATCFGFLLSSLFSTTYRILLITFLVMVATQLPVMIIESVDNSVGLSIFSSLFYFSGLVSLMNIIVSWENYGEGLQWSNLFEIPWPGEAISVGCILLVMLLVSFLSLLLCLYIEQIRPGTYGVPRPWHFPCTYCCSTDSFVPYRALFNRLFGIYKAAPVEERPDPKFIEPDPVGKIAGVQIRGLSKTFGKVDVVKNVSFEMFEGQITVLMGHNGAGKTTLISMVAGFIPPTSGTAVINGFDIRQERRKAQSCIGLCQQHNALFKHLSSSNHIELFSRLRGLRGAKVKEEVQNYLTKLNLEDKKRSAARNLSGGTQRRLSVACSLCGGVKVLICDEPSTGLDPGARRELWRLILEAKEGCTILLTTHQLDDGEVLGDRMVIISDGQLRCIGSLSFLKKLVDASCLLTCEARKRCDVEQLTALISRHVGNIQPFSIMGRDICYKLPLSKSNSFSSLFRDLERQMNTLGVRGFSMSSVSLEEIFMSFGAEDADTRKTGGADKRDDDNDDQGNGEDEDRDENVRSCGKQWRAMMTKKILALYDSKVFFIFLMLIPIVYYLTMLILAKNHQELGRQTMNITEYGNDRATILLSVPEKKSYKEERRLQYIASLIKGEFQFKVISEPVKDFVKNAWKSREGTREITFMPMAIDTEDRLGLIGWVGPMHYVHAAPMILNLVYNAMARELIGPKISIEVTSAPFIEKSELKGFTPEMIAVPLSVSLFVGCALIIFSNAVIQEQLSHMKMQQEVSGLGMITYWLSHLTFDFVVYFILVLALLLPLYRYGPWYLMLIVLLVTGLAGLMFTYFLIVAFAASFLIVSLIIFSSVILTTLILGFGMLALKYEIVYVLIYVANLHPIVACHQSIIKVLGYNNQCGSYISETNETSDQVNCINPVLFVEPRCVCENPMIWPEMLIMLLEAIIIFMLIMFLEYGSCIWYRCIGCCTTRSKSSIEDPKVSREAEKIRAMDADQIRSRALVVDEVSKKYGCGPLAVNNISFALKPKHCLGLLGPNGAGKTSTFKMIVGEHVIDKGNIYIAGYSMKMNRNKAMKEIGYCPQFDSFFEFLTGRQLLKLFLLLKGCSSKHLNERCEQLSDQFGFRKHLDKRITYYSGGTKRKINAAVACGATSLICLDEPSAGVDPASRRHVWIIINEVAQQGKAVLLTSHNMDEINALCSKSVVLVDGSIYAMGSNQHVKNKICKGMVLKLVVNEEHDKMVAMLTRIEEDINKSYPKAELKEKYEFSGRLTYIIPEDTSWSQIFEFVEGNRRSWKLADYSLSQPSLEDVFEEIAEERRKKK
ncbi:retinal-specific phospholipid-transporting ATPase ABCA4 isoform X1 [Drosophila santomea]|uniref:retinal-specific phospholipid-transporting ATPase ABCA4 isoform X1 n=1 Tax=Drosophila santomea TaxID=129105 RepID=UPI001952B81C|nr:retinal-specific phospholipid-transporting ATPase ABCA4 isoform X1 [Drosophila santomea]